MKKKSMNPSHKFPEAIEKQFVVDMAEIRENYTK